jgi:hypothetical protein
MSTEKVQDHESVGQSRGEGEEGLTGPGMPAAAVAMRHLVLLYPSLLVSGEARDDIHAQGKTVNECIAKRM